MTALATTKLSSKGQIVIPEAIRNTLGINTGTQFVVFADKDTVILKMITPPSLKEFDTLVKHVRKQARHAGLTKSALKNIVAKVRKEK